MKETNSDTLRAETHLSCIIGLNLNLAISYNKRPVDKTGDLTYFNPECPE